MEVYPKQWIRYLNARPNDQAEPQADRDRSGILKAGVVGRRRPLHFECG